MFLLNSVTELNLYWDKIRDHGKFLFHIKKNKTLGQKV